MVIRVQDKKREAQKRVDTCCSTAKASTFLPFVTKSQAKLAQKSPFSMLKRLARHLRNVECS